MDNRKIFRKIISLVLSLALLVGYLPAAAFMAEAATPSGPVVTDPGTADTWSNMMGTATDGNRYAGRVWADKSVYKDGDTAVLSGGQNSSTFQVALEEDEAFQVVFSVLGSSMTTTTTTSKTGPLDVVLILDDSTSMDDIISGNTTRLEKLIVASNKLLGDLLDSGDVRIGIVAYNYDAIQVLPFGKYENGITLSVLNNKYTFDENNRTDKGGTIQAKDNNGRLLYNNTKGYARGTNTQSGFNMGMRMLENATDTANRKPVAILLTDGAANTASDASFYRIENGTVRQRFYDNGVPVGVALGTLLNASYLKASVEDHYGKAPVVYGVGVDMAEGDGANAIINPGASDGFNSTNANANIREAYRLYTNTWLKGQTVTVSHSGYSFKFDHNYPNGSSVTDADVAANINYVDTYFDVAGVDLEDVFTQIYQELSSGVFNPISTTTTVEGATGVQNTPLIYVDFIGQYMELKEIQAVTLFGASYNVQKNANGTYTVLTGTGKNPATGENYNTSEDIRISVTEDSVGQKLQIEIDQEILPILLEKVDDRNVGGEHSATINELGQNPLRVYYTVGIDSDILLPNGEIDITTIDSGYPYTQGNEISFYSNQFGTLNPAPAGTNARRDAHVGFKPSRQNRYYYHQTNQDIFTAVSRKDGGKINWQADEYGVLYQEDAFNFTWLTYDKYNALQSDDRVYTYVTYWRPTAANTNAAEEVTYLVYTDWGYLKESVAFYDHNAETYINYHETNGYTTGKIGYAIPTDKVAATISAYKAANPNADIYGMLGVESLRTSRLHNMLVEKTSNNTDTADNRYAPEYTHDTAADHHGNDVVVWLGNNGKLTTKVDTGITLTKRVTEAIGSVSDTYALTVTVPAGVAATPVVKDTHGNTVASTYENNILTVPVKVDETVYITGIPAGTVCQVGEDTTGKDYYVSSKTDTVTVPTLAQVLGGAEQFAAATVTNSPNKYGDLTVIKDIAHDLTDIPAAMADKTFTFQVQLPAGLAGKEYLVDKTNATLFAEEKAVVAADGTFTVQLKENESLTVLNLPAGTDYTVTEINVPSGYTDTTGAISGTVQPDGNHDAHFVNTYGNTPIKPEITVTGTKTLNDSHNTYTAGEDFTFVLSRYTENGYVELATAEAKAGESYTFRLADELTEALGIGEYYFRVTEQTGTTPGMTYDATRGLFKVTVTDDDADGTLEFALSDAGNTTVSGNTVTKDFVNTYNVERTSVDIRIQKELTNKTGVNLPLNMFHFTLVNTGKPEGDADIADKTVTTDASGKATVRIADLGPGEYTFTLTEQDGNMPGMTYDTTPRTITVTVTKDDTGVLQAVTRIDGADTTEVTFQNKYALEKTSHTISGIKTLKGRNIEDKEFQFALYETDSSFELGANPVAKETVKNDGKEFSFSKIEYTKVGTYYYSVKEIVGSKAGVSYDTTHYHITVTIGVDGDELKKSVVVNKIGHNDDTSGDMVFVNTYTAKPTEYAISGTKVLNGRAMEAGEFTFELHDENGKISEAVNKADGTFTFESITYTAPGKYTYTVREAEGNAPGVSYTDAKVNVTVTVTDTDAVLSASADKKKAEIVLTNTYEAKAAKVSFIGKKLLDGGAPSSGDFTFHLYETDHTFDITGLTPKKTAKNDGTAISLGEFTYEKTGTRYYAVVEDTSNPLENVVYDRSQHNYMVQVSDIGDGQLRAQVTNLDTGRTTQAEKAVAANPLFINATFDEVTEKEVFTGGTSTLIDGQQVKAGDRLTYHITYQNYTGEPVVVDIMDTIPNHTTYVEGSASHGGTYAGTHVQWILNVEDGGEVTVSFDVTVDHTQAIVTNEAVIRDGVNTYTTNLVKNHTVDEEVEKDVLLPDGSASVDGKKVYEGDELLYEITFHNITDAPVDMEIIDELPANTTYVEGSASHGGVYQDGVLTWEIAAMPAWSTVTVTFKVTVNENIGAVIIKNQATATDGTNNYKTNIVTNYTVEDEVEKKVLSGDAKTNIDGKTVNTGDKLTYTISYRNTAAEAADVTITDKIPQYTTYVKDSASQGGEYADGELTWKLQVAAGESVTVSFQVKVTSGEGEKVTNQATVLEGKNTYTTNAVTVSVGEEDPNKPPKTGDNTDLLLWLVMLIIGAYGMVASIILGRKKEEIQ